MVSKGVALFSERVVIVPQRLASQVGRVIPRLELYLGGAVVDQSTEPDGSIRLVIHMGFGLGDVLL